jgi:hypothetical protein
MAKSIVGISCLGDIIMYLGQKIQDLTLFIVLNPLEWTVYLIITCIFIGMYLENIFHLFGWGLKCRECHDYWFHSDYDIICNECKHGLSK